MSLGIDSVTEGRHSGQPAGSRLRIAQVAPLYESVPPPLYGGTERVVAYLADALVDLGHDVTLFASGDSRTRAALCVGRAKALRLDESPLKSDVASHFAMLHEVRRRADEFDILHFHTDFLHFPLFADMASRTVTTLHGRLDLPDLPAIFRAWPEYPLISISDNQRRPLREAKWIATVAHGLPVVAPPAPAPGSGGYLAFVGRVAPEKRVDRAIRIAGRAGLPLKIAAKVDAADERYFNKMIEPLIDEPHVEFLGELGEPAKLALLEGAHALVFPIDWPEPFGLVMIEAMSRGTPVIAWKCGSVPEVIEDGVTGLIVADEDAAVLACSRVGALDRRRIRDEFEKRFSAPVMARHYVDVYERIAQPVR